MSHTSHTEWATTTCMCPCKPLLTLQGQEFYPLGKPNKRPLAAAHKKKAEKKKPSSSSFFDFLIPSFVRGASSKADREGPQVNKVNKQRRPGMFIPLLDPKIYPYLHWGMDSKWDLIYRETHLVGSNLLLLT